MSMVVYAGIGAACGITYGIVSSGNDLISKASAAAALKGAAAGLIVGKAGEALPYVAAAAVLYFAGETLHSTALSSIVADGTSATIE